MTKLIKTLSKRDTKSNIEQLQNELMGILAKNNPFKKGISMYKIK